jgi:hypothetical protein
VLPNRSLTPAGHAALDATSLLEIFAHLDVRLQECRELLIDAPTTDVYRRIIRLQASIARLQAEVRELLMEDAATSVARRG